MASLDSLPPDQRAVLQLVLQRGRSYDEIASLLGIDRAAVRRRALDGFDGLGPSNSIPAPQRALLTDYLLGQLPPRVAVQVRERLAGSPPDRAWARVVSAEIASLTTGPLPEIPVGSPRPAYPEPTPELRPAAVAAPSEETEPPLADFDDEPTYGSWSPRERASDAEPAAAASAPERGATPPGRIGGGERPSSRLGGAIVLAGIAIVVVAVVVVLLIVNNGSSPKHPAASVTTPPTTTTSATTATTRTTGTSTTAVKPKLLAEIELTSPTGDKKTTGVAQVIKDGTIVGIVIVADGVPANTKANAYAVWLYNSPSDAHLLGFVSALVNATGKLQTDGQLPANATSYHQVLVTLETQSSPKHPGKVVLQGSFSES